LDADLTPQGGQISTPIDRVAIERESVAMTTIDLNPIIQIIHRTVREAVCAGVDFDGQTKVAALAILEAEPTIRPYEAVLLVKKIRHGLPAPDGAPAKRH